MKNKIIAAMLFAFVFNIMPYAHAAGIPTVSATELAQMVVNAQQQAKEALAQLNKAKEAIAQAKSQYDHYKGLIEGNSNLADFLNDPLVNDLIPLGDWTQIYNDAKNLPDLRQRYGLISEDPAVQKAFDKLLMKADVLEKEKSASDTRVQNAQKMRAKLNTVQTPQEKQDLSLRYQQEMLELQTQQIRMQNIKELAAEKEKLEDKKRAQDFMNYMNGKSDTLPTRE